MNSPTDVLEASHTALLADIAPQTPGGRVILDPATGEIVGYAPVHTVEDLEAAVATAHAAQPGWAGLGHERRGELLLAAADAIDAKAEALAQILTREQGKPLNGPNARFEVAGASGWLRAAAVTPLEPEVVVDDGDTHAELHYRPIGVVGAIGPWNWPQMITVWQIAPALRMGNSVVVKPSEHTPLSVLALIAVINEVLPEGVLNIVVGDGQVGAALTAHPWSGR
ncbi:hypothetical protein GCM10009747_04440 [Agromyces humatus]|uniref:Aldehyde dehydrogenase domain-containing protein n=1 Tax=Agromyces humatus TaxID=279573 RepID=A0ABN2K833_9MICO